jgi:hypothetical protein
MIGMLALSALAAGGGAAGRYWIIPAVIRGHVISQIGTYWDGRVDVRNVGFSWSGSIRLEDMDLYDSAGRRWAHAGHIELGLRSLISSAPVLERLVTQDLAVEWHYGPGVRPPLKEAAGDGAGGGGGAGGGLDLRSLRMTGCTFALLDPNGGRHAWEFNLAGGDLGDVFTLWLLPHVQSPSASAGQAGVTAEGLILKGRNWMRLTVTMNRRFASDEVAAILAAAGGQEAVDRATGMAGLAGGGVVDANVAIDLPLGKPWSFQMLGQAEMSNWQLRDAGGALAEGAHARVTFGPDRRLDVEISEANLAKALSALEPEKGGAFDLKTRLFDWHVVGAGARQPTPFVNLP